MRAVGNGANSASARSKRTLIRLGLHAQTGELYVLAERGACGPQDKGELLDEIGLARHDWAHRTFEFDPELGHWAASQPWTILAWAFYPVGASG